MTLHALKSKKMKRILWHILIFAAPYLVVMLCWALSLGSFDYTATVTSDNFYNIAAVYWIALQWPIYMLVEEAL